EGAVVGVDLLEHFLRVADHVQFVDRQHHVAYADQGNQIAVPASLGQHALAGVDQNHRNVGGGGAGDHVAGVLLVSRGVGDDELAFLGGEEAVGHVDGDALLAFGGQAIDQQGEVQVIALGAVFLRV